MTRPTQPPNDSNHQEKGWQPVVPAEPRDPSPLGGYQPTGTGDNPVNLPPGDE